MQSALFEMPAPVVPPRIGPAVVRGIDSRHVLTPGCGRTADFDYTLNPYRGCSFGCSYCFAAAFVPDERMKADWGRWVEVKTQAIEVIRSKHLYNRSIFMSSATDPYQPVEARLELTRGIVKELLKVQARLVVQTRSPLVTRDIDLFRQFRNIRVNVSITTDDDNTRKLFEPGCASIERRMEAVRQLKAAGIRTNVCVLPMLPLTNPVAFARELRRMGVDHVAAGYFIQSDRQFASNTRDDARRIAAEVGWTREEFERTLAVLRRELANVTNDGRGFEPV